MKEYHTTNSHLKPQYGGSSHRRRSSTIDEDGNSHSHQALPSQHFKLSNELTVTPQKRTGKSKNMKLKMSVIKQESTSSLSTAQKTLNDERKKDRQWRPHIRNEDQKTSQDSTMIKNDLSYLASLRNSLSLPYLKKLKDDDKSQIKSYIASKMKEIKDQTVDQDQEQAKLERKQRKILKLAEKSFNRINMKLNIHLTPRDHMNQAFGIYSAKS